VLVYAGPSRYRIGGGTDLPSSASLLWIIEVAVIVADEAVIPAVEAIVICIRLVGEVIQINGVIGGGYRPGRGGIIGYENPLSLC
jgi:hypothetical protein